MGHKQHIACDCGGELPRPMPIRCPHCGRPIVAIRRRRWPLAMAVLIIGLIFAALLAYLRWLLLFLPTGAS